MKEGIDLVHLMASCGLMTLRESRKKAQNEFNNDKVNEFYIIKCKYCFKISRIGIK